MNTEALRRAIRGAHYLDKILGPNWRRRINRDRLDLASGQMVTKGTDCGCILTQLAPSKKGTKMYWDGVERVGVESSAEQVELGFVDDMYGNVPVSYYDLNDAWNFVLKEKI